jgi:2-oxoglutarate ferredoxin oxidoreductase subunit gamma
VRTEVRLAGFGGQGIILAGVILGEGAICDGKNAVQTQSYGPESRGGAARSEVVIADETIHYPRVILADYFVALSQPGYDKYRSELKREGSIILDEDLVVTSKEERGKTIHRMPFTRIADELGNRIVSNMVMLGSLCAITQVVSADGLKEAISVRFAAKLVDLNLEAFERGREIALRAAGGGSAR